MVNVIRNSDGSLNLNTVIDNPPNGKPTSLEVNRLARRFNPQMKIINTQQETADDALRIISKAK